MKSLFSRPGSLFIIILTHIAWALSFPPFPLGVAVFFLFIPMFYVTSRLTSKQAFWYHVWGGMFFNSIMYFWLYNVMKVGPPLIILSGLMLLVFIFSLLHGYLGLWARFLSGRRLGWLLFGLLWTGFEVGRTWGEMSFPWSHSAYMAGSHLALVQSVSIWGVFGLSFIIMSVNFLAFQMFRKKGVKVLVIPSLVMALLWVAGESRLSEAPSSDVKNLDVSIVQPSVEQVRKWDELYFTGVVKKTFDLVNPASVHGTDMIIMAETAIPYFLKRKPGVQRALGNMSLEYNAEVITGSLDYKPFDHPGKDYVFYNSAFRFVPENIQAKYQYSKLKLVPFSERLPFEDVFPVINYVDLGEGDFTPGDSVPVWERAGVKFSPTICYEIVYPAFIGDIVAKGAELIVNITNDGWFGDSPAPHQHANISKFRAVEFGLPIARCANSGISVFYDEKGRTISETKLFDVTVLRENLQVRGEDTLYRGIYHVTEHFFFWCWLVMNLWVVAAWARRRMTGR